MILLNDSFPPLFGRIFQPGLITSLFRFPEPFTMIMLMMTDLLLQRRGYRRRCAACIEYCSREAIRSRILGPLDVLLNPNVEGPCLDRPPSEDIFMGVTVEESDQRVDVGVYLKVSEHRDVGACFFENTTMARGSRL